MCNLLRAIVIGALLLGMAFAVAAAERGFSVTPLEQTAPTRINMAATLDNSDCYMGNLNSPAYWYTALELPQEYKLVFDPGATCSACPGGFRLSTIYFCLVALDTCTISVSVDLERAVLESPGCYFPGELLCETMTSELWLPGSGTYEIDMDLSPDFCPGQPSEGCFSMAGGPYCLGVRFEGASSLDWGPVIDGGGIQPCVSWIDWGFGWYDFPTVWGVEWPGEIVIWAGADCCELGPVCSIEPLALDFGSVPVGSHEDLDFTITNVGGAPLEGTVSECCIPYNIVEGEGDYCLAPGESRTVTVRYAPMTVSCHECDIWAGEECEQVACTGTGEPIFASFPCWYWTGDCLGGPNQDVSTLPACIMDDWFDSVFPGFVTVGRTGAGRHCVRWNGPAAVKAFRCGYGLPAVLQSDYVDPTTFQLGSIYGEALALKLNCEFSCEGCFTDRVKCYYGAVVPPEVIKFAGLTVDQLLNVAHEALSGNMGALLPYGNSLMKLESALRYMNGLYKGGCWAAEPPPALRRIDDGGGGEAKEAVPEGIAVMSWPNPTEGAVSIELALPGAASVSMDLYDVRGRRVATVARGSMGEGSHQVMWNGADDSGAPVASGVYFLRVEVDGRVAVMHKLTKL